MVAVSFMRIKSKINLLNIGNKVKKKYLMNKVVFLIKKLSYFTKCLVFVSKSKNVNIFDE